MNAINAERYALELYDSTKLIYTANTIKEINEFILDLPKNSYNVLNFELVATRYKVRYVLDYEYYNTTDKEDKCLWYLAEPAYEPEGYENE